MADKSSSNIRGNQEPGKGAPAAFQPGNLAWIFNSP
jgi:hypothetical protein